MECAVHLSIINNASSYPHAVTLLLCCSQSCLLQDYALLTYPIVYN
jgi:hypothetical protein